MLQLQLEKFDHFHRWSCRSGNRDTGMAISRKDLLDRSVTDDVSGRCSPIASHHNTVGVTNGHDRCCMGYLKPLIDCSRRGHWNEALQLRESGEVGTWILGWIEERHTHG
jgi:hypothetical protein